MANWYSYQAHAQDSSTGATIGSAQIEVFEAGTSNQATLASDRSGTTLTNPFNADANGYFQFYVGAGLYDVVVSNAGNSQTFSDLALGPAESLDGLPDPAAARTAIQLNNVRNVTQYSQTEADGRFVNETGDSMTGALNFANSDPIQASGNNAIEFDGAGNVTLPGDLTVGGTTTSVNTDNMDVDDPLIKLADGNTSTAVDIGWIGQRGGDNVGVVWDESADEFAAVLTADDGSTTTISISDYADLHVGTLTADDAIMQAGTQVFDVTRQLGATDGQALVWNNTAGEWEPQDQSGGSDGLTDSDLAANGGSIPEVDRTNTFAANQKIEAGDGTTLVLGTGSNDADSRVRLEFRGRYGPDFAGGEVFSFLESERQSATGAGDLVFGTIGSTGTNATESGRATSDGGLVWGSPAGESQGAGTTNAEEVYENGNRVCNPSGSAIPFVSFGSWETLNSDRPTFLFGEVEVATDGNNSGTINVDVDESGGTASDYNRTLAEISFENGAGSRIVTWFSMIIPAGGSVRINNASDPNSENDFRVRSFTL